VRALRYRVQGRVQGVGFRAFVVRLGRSCGVRGRVRNERDGSVTVVAQGVEDGLSRMRDGLEKGPPVARVLSVEEEPLSQLPGPDGFDADF
jgi:acylphosphatase